VVVRFCSLQDIYSCGFLNLLRREQKMKNIRPIFPLSSAILLIAGLLLPSLAATAPIMTNQGTQWTSLTRQKFYTLDQGSRIMPLKWLRALKQANGLPFMANSMSRYGYLPNPNSVEANIPVGFSITVEKNGNKTIGMTCSACHTRQIEVSGVAYRIDGGPSITNMQAFMMGIHQAVNTVLTDSTAFTGFATSVLGHLPLKTEEDALRASVKNWFLPYHTLVSKALPTQSPWGVGRLDAVSMIFNRLTGLDIGTTANHMIPENIKLADAPVRYPFLWNAPVQDYTQWPGFSPNGSRLLGLSRNLGEVIGVFARFYPKQDATKLFGMNYIGNNSANFAGLNTQEDLIMKLSAPKWPWTLNTTLAASGKLVFNKRDPNGENKSCADCHGIKEGESRAFADKTWATPVVDVGTDSREIGLLGYEVKTGVMENAKIFPDDEPIKAVDKAIKVLATAGLGSIIQHYVTPILNTATGNAVLTQPTLDFGLAVSLVEKDWSGFGELNDLKATSSSSTSTTPSYPYEARVLKGIWAVAPYLHNGSVPTLADLLKPAANRTASFKVGPAYDIVKVGLASTQTKFNYTLKTTDCTARNSGNSRCGHEYGTRFTAQEKTALIEYLKSL
jgi:cytochrome c553